MVEHRIVAAERKLEAELAFLCAVAGAGVAAELGPLANTQGKPEVGPFVQKQ